jgi:hypothetical protein
MLYVMVFPMINILYFYIDTSRSICAVPSVAVFCTSSISYFPVMFLGYFLISLRRFQLPHYYWWHVCLHIHHTLCVCCKVFMLQNLPASFSITFYLLIMQCPFRGMFRFHCRVLLLLLLLLLLLPSYLTLWRERDNYYRPNSVLTSISVIHLSPKYPVSLPGCTHVLQSQLHPSLCALFI